MSIENIQQRFLDDDPIPSGSLYLWMYRAGLHAISEWQMEQLLVGREVRRKDWENWARGFEVSLIARDQGLSQSSFNAPSSLRLSSPTNEQFAAMHLSQFRRCDELTDYERRWVPCTAANKPMVKWSKELMTLDEAISYPDSRYLAECLCDTPYVVFDIDADHGGILNLELINTFYDWKFKTHVLSKPRRVEDCIMEDSMFYTRLWDAPTSFHITFRTDRVIPTKHFPDAGIDLLGNATRQLRYRKDKQWNGIYPIPLTDEVWEEFMRYIRYTQRERKGIRI